jgi:hypothetical protein
MGRDIGVRSWTGLIHQLDWLDFWTETYKYGANDAANGGPPFGQ